MAGSVRSARRPLGGLPVGVQRDLRQLPLRRPVRLDADGPADPGDLLAALHEVVADAGLTRTARTPQPDKLRAARDDLSVSFWQLPAGSEGALLLTVQGGCVDVPEDERDAWRDRRETEPDPLA